MQILSCNVALGGDIRTQIPKRITVPELVVLEAIHGHGSVTEVVKVGMDKREHGKELARLRRIYGKAGEREGQDIVSRLFPGYAPKLPVRLSEIGRGESDPDEGEENAPEPQPVKTTKKKVGKKKAGKKVAAKAADDGDNDDSDSGKDDEDDNDALS